MPSYDGVVTHAPGGAYFPRSDRSSPNVAGKYFYLFFPECTLLLSEFKSPACVVGLVGTQVCLGTEPVPGPHQQKASVPVVTGRGWCGVGQGPKVDPRDLWFSTCLECLAEAPELPGAQCPQLAWVPATAASSDTAFVPLPSSLGCDCGMWPTACLPRPLLLGGVDRT